MTTERPSSKQSGAQTEDKGGLRAYIFTFVFLLILIGVWIWKAEKLAMLGLTSYFYFIVLAVLALFSSALLFGVLSSTARYRGKQFDGRLTLGGPVVLFLLVLILGFLLPNPASNFPLTVYVHGAGGLQDPIISGTCYVVIDTGGFRRKSPIGDDGSAIFTEVPASLRGQDVPITLDARDYELVGAQQKAHLGASSVYVQARRKAGQVAGYVHDARGRVLANVTITGLGESVTTDHNGYFVLNIPGERLQPSFTLEALSPGFKLWVDTVVPESNEVQITLQRQR